jgi:RimJ/RimL family protein N-acetyltransferase
LIPAGDVGDLGDAMTSVTLRPLRDEDREPMFDLESERSGADMIAFLPRAPGDREAFDKHWQRITSPETDVLLRSIEVDGSYGGYALSFVVDGQREIGYWVSESLWGRGVATAALRELLAEIDERPLFARVAIDNEGSRRVLEKCGFVIVGEEENFAPRRDHALGAYVLRLDS